MSDFVHCNNCKCRPASECDIRFFLTNCGHIFCKHCIDKGVTIPKCKKCSQPCSAVEVNRQLKPDLQLFFNDAKAISARANKQLYQIQSFQDNQRATLIKFYSVQLKQWPKVVARFREHMKPVKDQEKKVEWLKSEIKREIDERQALKAKHYEMDEKFNRPVHPQQDMARTIASAVNRSRGNVQSFLSSASGFSFGANSLPRFQ